MVLRLTKSKRRFHRALLANEFALAEMVPLLKSAVDGGVPLSRIFRATLVGDDAKARVRRHLRRNLATIEAIRLRNRCLLSETIDGARAGAARREAWRQIAANCRRASRLIEELDLSEERLRGVYRQIVVIAERWQCFEVERRRVPAGSVSADAYGEAMRSLVRRAGVAPARFPNWFSRLRALEKEFSDAKQAFIEANMPLVRWMARRGRPFGLSRRDYEHEGVLGLIRAVEKYDMARGARFGTYAAFWIAQAMRRTWTPERYAFRVPEYVIPEVIHCASLLGQLRQRLGHEPSDADLAAATGHSLDDAHQALITQKVLEPAVYFSQSRAARRALLRRAGEEAADPNEEFAREVARRAEIDEWLSELNERSREVIRLRFGLGDGQVHTLEEIGGVYGVSRERIRQIQDEALRKIRMLLGLDPQLPRSCSW